MNTYLLILLAVLSVAALAWIISLTMSKNKRLTNDLAVALTKMDKPTQYAPGTQIGFSAQLVPELKQEHRQLLDLFGQIVAAQKDMDVALIQAGLDNMKTALTGHLLKENVRLYVYLQKSLSADADNSALVSGFRQEMDGIGRAVSAFIQKYLQLKTWGEAEHQSFGTELHAIGQALGKRIASEESSLYPLYASPDSY